MSIAVLLLNNLSMEGWSVIQAEDSEGYLLAARFFSGEDIPPDSLPLSNTGCLARCPFYSSSSRPADAS